MWGQVDTNKSVGALFPNDGDGNAWGDKQVGFPPVLEKQGYKLTDPGRYQNLTDNFSAQITAFKNAKCRDRHRRGAAARLHHVLEAGAAAGLQAEGGLGRQGDPVPRRRSRRWARTATTSPRRCGGRRAIPSSPRSTAERQAAGRRLRGRHQEAVDAADRLHPLAVRGGDSTCSSARRRSATPRRPWRRSRATNLDTVVGKVAVERQRRAAVRGQERDQDRRWSAASGASRTATSTTSSSPTTDGAQHPRRRQDGGDRLTHRASARSVRRSGRSAPTPECRGRPRRSDPPQRCCSKSGASPSLRLAQGAPTASILRVARGEAVGIIGPNGAGKIDAVQSDRRQSRRRRAARSCSTASTSRARRAHERCRAGIGRSYQIPQPFENLTVFENLLVAAVHGRGREAATASISAPAFSSAPG